MSIEEKVKREAQKPGPDYPENYGYSVMPGDFRKMHETIQSMRLCETAAGGEPFVGLLFEWQVKLSQT